MNYKKLLVATIIAGSAFTITSCSKYEDGPKFSLLTKKMRLVGEWQIEEYEDEDGTIVSSNGNETFTIERDGTYRANYGNISYKGEWEFSDDKEDLKVSYQEGSITVTTSREILRLTNKELWLEESDGDIIRAKAK